MGLDLPKNAGAGVRRSVPAIPLGSPAGLMPAVSKAARAAAMAAAFARALAGGTGASFSAFRSRSSMLSSRRHEAGLQTFAGRMQVPGHGFLRAAHYRRSARMAQVLGVHEQHGVALLCRQA